MLRGTGIPLPSGLRPSVLGALIGLAVVLAIPSGSLARLRPIARVMIEALETVNQIGQGLSIEDYEASERAARNLRNQAKKENAHAALEGLEQLLQSACLACHRKFRDPAKLLRPPVLYATNFLSA